MVTLENTTDTAWNHLLWTIGSMDKIYAVVLPILSRNGIYAEITRTTKNYRCALHYKGLRWASYRNSEEEAQEMLLRCAIKECPGLARQLQEIGGRMA